MMYLRLSRDNMKKIFAVLSLLMFQQLAFAQAVPVLMVPSDSRSMAMGGIDMQRDADNMDIQAFYGMWAPKSADNKMFGGNAFFRIGKDLGVSLEGRVFKDKPYDIISEKGMATGESFSPSDKIFGAGARSCICNRSGCQRLCILRRSFCRI